MCSSTCLRVQSPKSWFWLGSYQDISRLLFDEPFRAIPMLSLHRVLMCFKLLWPWLGINCSPSEINLGHACGHWTLLASANVGFQINSTQQHNITEPLVSLSLSLSLSLLGSCRAHLRQVMQGHPGGAQTVNWAPGQHQHQQHQQQHQWTFKWWSDGSMKSKVTWCHVMSRAYLRWVISDAKFLCPVKPRHTQVILNSFWPPHSAC